MFKKIKEEHYQYMINTLVDDLRLSALETKCEKMGIVEKFSNQPLEADKLYCFFNKDEKINDAIPMDTYYFIYNNTCIVYSRMGLDKIVRIRVKNPKDCWGENTQYAEIYDWWDVDWMRVNRRDTNMYTKSGAWSKSVYKDITKIYELVSNHVKESEMDGFYRAYEKDYRRAK